MARFGLTISPALSSAPVTIKDGLFVFTGAIVNLPAVAIIGLLTALLIVGIRASATVNGLMVLLKVLIVVLVILFGLPLIQMANLVPFVPENTGTVGEFGWSGILRAAGVIFFAYIGFDAVSVAAQEAKNPQRDMPIGILGSLAICTVLYILMSLTMVGLTPYPTLKVANPVSVAIAAAGDQVPAWLGGAVEIGAIAGLSTVILISLYGQSRIFYSMSRDGLLPCGSTRSTRGSTPARHADHRWYLLCDLQVFPDRHSGRTRFDRNAACVHPGVHRRHRVALHEAERAAAVQDAAVADRANSGRYRAAR